MTDQLFLAAFEDCSLPFGRWNHRAHVRVAYLYASRHRLHDAINWMRTGVQTHNAANKVPEGPEQGYHETTTQAFMRLIHKVIQERGPLQNSDEFCKRSPELLDRRVLLCYYTRDRIMEANAKVAFVEPDIAPLDRIGIAFPEFGNRVDDVTYTMRPGGYGVIADNSSRIAVVVTPTGIYLPGGGQENGESAIKALHRETLEECGLTIHIKSPIGVADERVFAEEEDQHFCKRCSFYAAQVLASGESTEADHSLVWVRKEEAVAQLSQQSQQWAVSPTKD